MVCFQVMGNNETISLAAQAGQLEMNFTAPLIAKNLFESFDLLTNGIREFNDRCVKGIIANKDICYFYYEHSAGLATLLNPYIGYDKAAEIAKESIRSGKTIRDTVVEKKLLSKRQFREIFGG